MRKSTNDPTNPQFDISEEMVEQLLSQVQSSDELFG